MLVNLSFIKLSGDVKDNYTKTLKGFRNKDVEWSRLKNVLSNSKVQFTPYMFTDGIKIAKNWDNSKQNMLVLDIDTGLSINECQNKFKKYKYLLGTTKSHQQLKRDTIEDRYRLCIPAINIPTDREVYFRMLALMFPFNDSATESLTGAFLGNDNAIIIYNEGILLDCYKASELAKEQLKNEHREKVVIDKDLLPIYSNNTNLDNIKSVMSDEIVKDILHSMGIEVTGNKFSLRPERTPSIKIYSSGYMKDFGASDSDKFIKGDIIQLVMVELGMSFRDAIKYIANYI